MRGTAAAALFILSAAVCRCDSLAEALRSHRFEEALSLSGSLLQTRPQDPEIWTARGLALAALGRETESISSFDKALELEPGYVPALKGAVEVTYRLHDPRAAALLNRLLRLQPGNGVAQAMAGVLAYEARDCGAAVRHFELGREQVSSNEKAYSLYGACLTTLRRSAEAVPVFQQLLAEHPGNGDLRFDLGYALLLAGKPADAVATLEQFAGERGADALNLLAAARSLPPAGRMRRPLTCARQSASLLRTSKTMLTWRRSWFRRTPRKEPPM